MIEQVFQHYLDLEWLDLDLPAASAITFVVGTRERNFGKIDQRIRDRYKTAKSAYRATMDTALRRCDEDSVNAALDRHFDMMEDVLESLADKVLVAWLQAASKVRNESLPLDASRDGTDGDPPR